MKTPSREIAANSEDARAAEAAKITRLRALRLAKEAADRDAQQKARSRPAPGRSYGSILPGRANEVS